MICKHCHVCINENSTRKKSFSLALLIRSEKMKKMAENLTPFCVFHSHMLEYSVTGAVFQRYGNGREFQGNTEESTAIVHHIEPAITARYIKVIAVE